MPFLESCHGVAREVRLRHTCHMKTKDEDLKAGEAVGRLAQERGMSLAKIANAIGVDRASLSRSVHGKRRFRAVEIAQIASLLGVTVEQIMPSAAGAATQVPVTESQQPVARMRNPGRLLTLEEFRELARMDLSPRHAILLSRLHTRIRHGQTWDDWWQTIREIEKVFAAFPGIAGGATGGSGEKTGRGDEPEVSPPESPDATNGDSDS